MDDLISRQEAIDSLFELYEYQRAIDPTEAADLVRQGVYLAEKKIEQLPSAQPERRWIPCSERLPERNLVVLVTTKWGEVTEGVKLSGNAWFIGRGEENAYDSDILAWMEKPEPYAERRTDGINNMPTQ